MSNNKKKKRKGLSNETLSKIKNGFGTILSNEAVIKSAREMKGPLDLIAIGLALASIVLSVLPTFISRINIKASSAVFSSPVALYDQGVSEFIDALVYDPATGAERAQALELKISEAGTFSFSKEDQVALTGGEDKWFTLTRASTSTPVFEVFFNNNDALEDNTFFDRIYTNKNPYTGEERTADVKTVQTSYMAFGKNNIRFQRVIVGQTTAVLPGRYDRLGGTDFTAKAKELRAAGLSPAQAEYVTKVTEYMSNIINLSYETDKVAGAWQYTGIFAGVNTGLIVLFGLVIFLMTRGKKNPFRIINFWETQKIAYWACFTPAIISMIGGFLLTQYAFIFFMFTFGMRMMWMSMRSLRPVVQ